MMQPVFIFIARVVLIGIAIVLQLFCFATWGASEYPSVPQKTRRSMQRGALVFLFGADILIIIGACI